MRDLSTLFGVLIPSPRPFSFYYWNILFNLLFANFADNYLDKEVSESELKELEELIAFLSSKKAEVNLKRQVSCSKCIYFYPVTALLTW